LGGEGVAYHTPDKRNHGSGELNPANGTYLNEFRMNEAVGTSYVKFHDAIDKNPFNQVQPAEGQLYVGWTSPGEWFRITVQVERAGTYSINLLHCRPTGIRDFRAKKAVRLRASDLPQGRVCKNETRNSRTEVNLRFCARYAS
jgi:hypothetical protein